MNEKERVGVLTDRSTIFLVNRVSQKLQLSESAVRENGPKPVRAGESTIRNVECMDVVMINQMAAKNGRSIGELMEVHPLQGNAITKNVAFLPGMTLIKLVELRHLTMRGANGQLL